MYNRTKWALKRDTHTGATEKKEDVTIFMNKKEKNLYCKRKKHTKSFFSMMSVSD